MENPLAPLTEIMRRHNVRASVEEFHAAVNVTFHKYESDVYDDLHTDMWESLPQQVELLAQDCLRRGVSERLAVLDIGSGTGLATDLLMRSGLGAKVETVDLLDTSAVMLERASARRAKWGKSGRAIEGLLESLGNDHAYDLIITCSVLHHIPDLPSFLQSVARLQQGRKGAFFIHLQDPNGEMIDDPQRLQRAKEFEPVKVPDTVARFKPSRIIGRLVREIKGEKDYIAKMNQELMGTGIISSPLSVDDLFTITDIHVRDGGISIKRLQGWLPDYSLVSQRTYGFYGVLRSHLPDSLRQVEDRLVTEGALNGEHVGACWIRN